MAQKLDARLPCGLLARLAHVAEAEDLPLLKRTIVARRRVAGRRSRCFVVEAVSRIRTPEADGTLLSWFRSYKPLQVPIAINLIARENVPRDRIRRLVTDSGDARAQIVVKAMLNDDRRPGDAHPVPRRRGPAEQLQRPSSRASRATRACAPT
jgi:hypothetical protein